MTAELFRTIEESGACVDLSGRAKWQLAGPDRVRYLNGQVTNDVRRAGEEEAIYTCVTNAKGRIEGEGFIHALPEGGALLLDAEPGLREPLGARLEKYIVADDVELRDVTDEWWLLHWFGVARDAWREAQTDCSHAVRSSRFGEAGMDVWLPKKNAPHPVPGALLSAEDLETLRILRGLPRWPGELNGDAFPQEAGLEGRAMDFAKGCYIGQEVLSRIKLTGKMPRELIRFQVQVSRFKGRIPELPARSRSKPWRLLAQARDGLKDAGNVTSMCLHPELDRLVGLGYVRQGFALEHSLLLAVEDPPSILTEVEISGP